MSPLIEIIQFDSAFTPIFPIGIDVSLISILWNLSSVYCRVKIAHLRKHHQYLASQKIRQQLIESSSTQLYLSPIIAQVIRIDLANFFQITQIVCILLREVVHIVPIDELQNKLSQALQIEKS